MGENDHRHDAQAIIPRGSAASPGDPDRDADIAVGSSRKRARRQPLSCAGRSVLSVAVRAALTIVECRRLKLKCDRTGKEFPSDHTTTPSLTLL